MELDELKIQLQQHFEAYHPEKSVENIASLLHYDSMPIIDKIKRSLQFEIGINICFIAILLYLTFHTSTQSFKVFFGVFALLSTIFSGILFFLFKQAHNLTSGSLPVKNSIQELYDIIRRYTLKYTQFTMGLLPVFFIISFVVGYRQTLLGEDWEFDTLTTGFSGNPTFLLPAIAITVIAFLISIFFFTRWYLKKLYGNYLAELKILLDEFEE